KEHLDILALVGINKGVIAITKTDQADEELLEIILEDVKSTLADSFLKDAPIYLVDSLSNSGISELKNALKETLLNMPKKLSNLPFRLPIDHRSEEHTSELQSRFDLVCRLLLEKKNKNTTQ